MGQLTAHDKREAEYARNERLGRIFTPLSFRQRTEMATRQGIDGQAIAALRFAHYTSAESAFNILRTRKIWMRNTTCMADYREVTHGFEILQRYFTHERTPEFAAAFDGCAPGAVQKAIEFFNGWWKAQLGGNIYVSAISEHDQSEDAHGRLSMWRAFGNAPTKVAVVLNIPWKTFATEKLRIMFSPVAYVSEEVAHASLNEVADNVRREAEFLRSVGPEQIAIWLFGMLFSYLSCLKHEGFKEEREWRAIYCPHFNSELMKSSLEIIGGVPQKVLHLPLDERVDSELADLDIVRMLDRITVGPSPYPWVLWNSFVELLSEIGVPDAATKVRVSGIPIRS